MKRRTRLSFTSGLITGTLVVVAVQVALGHRLKLTTVLVTALAVAGTLLILTALRE